MTDAQAAVRRRLARLTGEWAGEQAIQFERRWLTWGDVGKTADELDAILEEQGIDGDAAVAVVVRQRPALLATELSALRAGRPVLLMSPLQADGLLVGLGAQKRPRDFTSGERDDRHGDAGPHPAEKGRDEHEPALARSERNGRLCTLIRW